MLRVSLPPVEGQVPTLIFRASRPVMDCSAAVSKLTVGDSATVHVKAHLPVNRTRLRVSEGEQYQFFVPPCQSWTDFFITKNPDGYRRGPIWFLQELFRGFKPLPDKNWFALAGAIDCPTKLPFLIGCGINAIPMKATGELVLFANDAAGFYWNNFGSLIVAITRLE